jgi:hypothetical protein
MLLKVPPFTVKPWESENMTLPCLDSMAPMGQIHAVHKE